MPTPSERDALKVLVLLDKTHTVKMGYAERTEFDTPNSMTARDVARRLRLTEFRTQRLIDEMLKDGLVVKVGFMMFSNEPTYTATAARERAQAVNAERRGKS